MNQGPIRWLRVQRMRWYRPPRPSFPVYALAGRTPVFSGDAWTGNRRFRCLSRSITLAHRDSAVCVETERHREPTRNAEGRLRAATGPFRPSDVRRHTIAVDGRPVDFTVLEFMHDWIAAADLDERTCVVIHGTEDDDIEAVQDLVEAGLGTFFSRGGEVEEGVV